MEDEEGAEDNSMKKKRNQDGQTDIMGWIREERGRVGREAG